MKNILIVLLFLITSYAHAQSYTLKEKETWINNKENSLENKLFEIYVNHKINNVGMTKKEAESLVEEMLVQAKQKVKQSSEDKLLSNLGTLMLQNEKNDPTHVNLHIKRSEGVKDDDILWFWNMNPLERRMIEIDDELTKLVAFQNFVEKGMTDKEAVKKMRKYFVYYGDPRDIQHVQGEDRPIPPELKNRINIWVAKNYANKEEFETKLKNFTTMIKI